MFTNMAGVEDDILVETVRNFSVLYDKAHADFHRKDVKKNAWNAVAEALGMEDGECLIFLCLWFKVLLLGCSPNQCYLHCIYIIIP